MSANHIKIIDIVGYKEENSNISYENPSCTRSSYDRVHASSLTDSSFCKQLPTSANSTSSDSTFSRPYEPPRFTYCNNRPSTSTSNNLYEQSTSTNWDNDRPSTSRSSYESASIDFCDDPPVRKKSRLEIPVTTTTTVRNTSRTPPSTASASGKFLISIHFITTGYVQ